jgi:hypothetical protein
MMFFKAARVCFTTVWLVWLAFPAHSIEPSKPLLYFVSDLHLGVGRESATGKWSAYEDFRWHDDLVAFLDAIGKESKQQAQLIVLGDFLELWQTDDMRCTGAGVKLRCWANDCAGDKPALGCTDKEIMVRLNRVLSEHADTLTALGQFASSGANSITIVPGNHDAGLLLPEAAAALLKAMGGTTGRVKVMGDGFWISTDGRIFADHGHQYDRVNLYRTWPTPFTEVNGLRSIERPWGELMVQQFFNEYERQFPTIDNLADEAGGMKYGVAALHARGVATGAGRFLGFLIADTSLRQKGAFIGAAKEGETAKWDLDAIKNKGTDFLVSTLAVDDPAYDALQAAFKRGEITARPADLEDEELETICETRFLLAEKYRLEGRKISMETCPTLDAASKQKLGYVVNKMLRRHRAAMAAHLRKTAAAIGGANSRPPMNVYIYGHTHSAASPERIKVTDQWFTVMANTGAFQRLAGDAYLEKLKTERQWKDADVMPSMAVEDLQPCYSYVRVDAYVPPREPKPKLLYWTQTSTGWRSMGKCS